MFFRVLVLVWFFRMFWPDISETLFDIFQEKFYEIDAY